ncbi:putative DNA primase/helicase [Crenobacter luteus]|uniref:DUF927 domain-containing protein n=1 Tax=Crenobacter luteus TaxID=1452487 RepID=UPI00104B22DD|nr:DUF927 domain-containing protein [Crenobacter luteus]TCP10888.1 putative DNA primase/helicase [Crenobacter luteus]
MSARDDLQRLQQAADAPLYEPKPRFEVNDSGVYFIDVKHDDASGQALEKPPVRLCDRLDLIGRGEDEAGNQYRILQWRSRGSHAVRRMAFPLGLAGEREGWVNLRNKGLAIATQRGLQDKLAKYLQEEGSDAMHHIAERGGWTHGAYIVPGGDVLGTPREPIFYRGDIKDASAYAPCGTLAGWRDGVARLARGHSRVMLALGCAFAAPLLDLVEMEAGGFHLYGDSTDGKTTAGRAGASVWGHHDKTKLAWDGTALGLANAAAARNDCLLFLDEVGQGDPNAVSLLAYRLFNGVGKAQGAREGGNREQPRWRVLVFSTGEHPVSEVLKAGSGRIKAGQSVRLPSIAADAGKGYGVFETLHGYPSAKALADDLKRQCGEHYGTAGRAFIEYVAPRREELAELIREQVGAWCAALPPSASQAARVVSRFAVVALALELATRAGITGWAEGEAHEAIHALMRAWLQRNGTGKHEDRAIVEQAEAFLALHGYSRFVLLPMADNEPRVANMAGYKRYDTDGNPEYIVFPPVFEAEVIAGHDLAKAQKVLADHGLLKRAGDGRLKTMVRTPCKPSGGRFYLLVSAGDEDGDAF